MFLLRRIGGIGSSFFVWRNRNDPAAPCIRMPPHHSARGHLFFDDAQFPRFFIPPFSPHKNAPSWTRTSNRPLRRRVLYPIELWALHPSDTIRTVLHPWQPTPATFGRLAGPMNRISHFKSHFTSMPPRSRMSSEDAPTMTS